MNITVTHNYHTKYLPDIMVLMESSAKQRGTGIAKRSRTYLEDKIVNGDAIIALIDKEFAGFCYIEAWDNKSYVAHSGLIVNPKFRGLGLGKQVKTAVFKYSKKKYPKAKIFGITTGAAVMKINYTLGYRPVTFSQLTEDELFWDGCKACKNYDILMRNDRKMCLCTGMLYDPEELKKENKILRKLNQIKQKLILKQK